MSKNQLEVAQQKVLLMRKRLNNVKDIVEQRGYFTFSELKELYTESEGRFPMQRYSVHFKEGADFNEFLTTCLNTVKFETDKVVNVETALIVYINEKIEESNIGEPYKLDVDSNGLKRKGQQTISNWKKTRKIPAMHVQYLIDLLGKYDERDVDTIIEKTKFTAGRSIEAFQKILRALYESPIALRNGELRIIADIPPDMDLTNSFSTEQKNKGTLQMRGSGHNLYCLKGQEEKLKKRDDAREEIGVAITNYFEDN